MAKISRSIQIGAQSEVIDKEMNTFAKAANDLDDGFAFYVDLYGHVDATIRYAFRSYVFSFKIFIFREFLCSKMATLFKSEFRPDVLGRGKRPGTSRDKPLGRSHEAR